jgi:ATP synthase protein I
MSADGREDGAKGPPEPSDDAALAARLKQLDERLARIEPERDKASTQQGPQASDRSALAQGFRLSAEFVSGIIAGTLVGWLMDRFVGTSPWGLIVGVLLGFGAGMLNLMRAAGVVAPPGSKRR